MTFTRHPSPEGSRMRKGIRTNGWSLGDFWVFHFRFVFQDRCKQLPRKRLHGEASCSAPGFLTHLDPGAGPAKGPKVALRELGGESRLPGHRVKTGRPAGQVHGPSQCAFPPLGLASGAAADSGIAGEMGLGDRREGSQRCPEAPPSLQLLPLRVLPNLWA